MTFHFLNPNEIASVCATVNADPEFRLASRQLSKDILITVGEVSCLIKIRDGAVVAINHDPTFMNPWSFFIKGSADAWEKFLQPIPPPTYTDLYGAIARRHFEMGGDIEAAFAHFWSASRMLDIFREFENGALPVSKGDLYYNFIDHNLPGGEARQIDTRRIAVYLMTGEYDWGNSPDQTRILAEQIKGSKFVELKGLGHFPMAENFSQFKSYLMPILHEIAAESAMPSR